jgi:sugar lactone lactonase YvrE
MGDGYSFRDVFTTRTGWSYETQALTFGPDGNLYLIDHWGVNRYHGTTGAYIDLFADTRPLYPTFSDLAFDPEGRLWVTGSSLGVERYESDGRLIDRLSPSHDALYMATGLAYGPDGHMYVAFSSTIYDDEIIRFHGRTGAYMGVYASGAGLEGATGVTFGPDGNLYVSSKTTHQVLRFEGPGIDSDGDGVPDGVDTCPYEDATGFDVDGDGCLDTMSGLTEMLEILLAEGLIRSELGNSLLSKVKNASKSVSKGNLCAAADQIAALIDEVNAQRGRKVSNEAADEVIAYAESVIARLLAELPPGGSC